MLSKKPSFPSILLFFPFASPGVLQLLEPPSHRIFRVRFRFSVKARLGRDRLEHLGFPHFLVTSSTSSTSSHRPSFPARTEPSSHVFARPLSSSSYTPVTSLVSSDSERRPWRQKCRIVREQVAVQLLRPSVLLAAIHPLPHAAADISVHTRDRVFLAWLRPHIAAHGLDVWVLDVLVPCILFNRKSVPMRGNFGRK